MLVVHEIDGNTSVKNFEQPMLESRDSKKVGGIPKESFPLVITATIEKFDIHLVIIVV